MPSSIIRLSDAVKLGMHAAAMLASEPDRAISVKDMAARLRSSEATLAKAMQRLVREGLVTSTRGPSGGFRLARSASDISLKEIFEAIEGPLGRPGCLFGAPVCGRDACMLGDGLAEVDRIIVGQLERTSLADVAIELGPCAKNAPAAR